jgi:hypothetical protein
VPIPHGNLAPEEAIAEVQEAMRFWEDLQHRGLAVLAMAEKAPAGRTPTDRDQLVNYLVLYRRVRALPRS